jgi:hypothetical protein
MSFSFPSLCEWEVPGGGIPGDGGGYSMLFWLMGVQRLWCIMVMVPDAGSCGFIKV